MTEIAVQLRRAARLLCARLDELAARVEGGDSAAWTDYLPAVQTIAAILPVITPGAQGQLLSSRELAERLGVSVKTVHRRRKDGLLKPALVLGQRGRAAVRWAADGQSR